MVKCPGDPGLIPGSGRSPGEGNGSTIAWKIPWTEKPGRLHIVHGVAKSRTRLSNFASVKATVFLAVMYRCESWAIKKAECQRIDAFKLQCWRRFLRVPWTARR